MVDSCLVLEDFDPKTGEETAEALESIIKELRCLDPFAEMVRFHTDAGKERLE